MHAIRPPKGFDPEDGACPEHHRMKPIVSDREFIIAMCFLALFGLFGAAVIIALLIGFWLTATNRWAADSAFLFATALILVVSVADYLFAPVRTFFTRVDATTEIDRRPKEAVRKNEAGVVLKDDGPHTHPSPGLRIHRNAVSDDPCGLRRD